MKLSDLDGVLTNVDILLENKRTKWSVSRPRRAAHQVLVGCQLPKFTVSQDNNDAG
jgi:hypothetical protein